MAWYHHSFSFKTFTFFPQIIAVYGKCLQTQNIVHSGPKFHSQVLDHYPHPTSFPRDVLGDDILVTWTSLQNSRAGNTTPKLREHGACFPLNPARCLSLLVNFNSTVDDGLQVSGKHCINQI